MTIPTYPKIYHITHMDNISGMVKEGAILPDVKIIERGENNQSIGMTGIKQRRIQELNVSCYPGTKVGDYVPFYFCPRSVMLYVIHRANNPELIYRGGQEPIVHLEADMYTVVRWAEENKRSWVFSLSNAGAYYTEFRSRLDELEQLDWQAIAATDFRNPDVKEKKQAEFLLYADFPFSLIERIGVKTRAIGQRIAQMLSGQYRPNIEVLQHWYFP